MANDLFHVLQALTEGLDTRTLNLAFNDFGHAGDSARMEINDVIGALELQAEINADFAEAVRPFFEPPQTPSRLSSVSRPSAAIQAGPTIGGEAPTARTAILGESGMSPILFILAAGALLWLVF